MPTMKAVRIHQYGGPDVLKYEDAPKPQPAPGEVLIRVHAAGVNPVDWKVREGYLKNKVSHEFPLIPGWDVSGVIEDTGSLLSRWNKGNEVYSRPDLSRDGAYAEYIVVQESEIALKPRSLNHAHAASVPLAALTAWQVLFDKARLHEGQKVLIHAAAGGVGTFAVQLAKWKGARVVGTASKQNHDFLRELGVEEVVDYNTARFEDAVHDADVVFDTIGGETQERSWKTLKRGGILVSIVSPPSELEAARHRVHSAYVFVQPNSLELTEIAELIDAHKLRPIVNSILPLAEARHAQELNQGGHTRGKIVLNVAF